MFLWAALMFVLALWMSVGRGQWTDSVLWYAIAIFSACFGGLLGGANERWHRPLLVVGLVAGAVAFVAALRATGIVVW
jgi:hypothetical protein